MRYQGTGITHPGQERDHNEDHMLVRNDIGLYLVADGMGGHAAGEVASEVAATTVTAEIEKAMPIFEAVRAGDAHIDAAVEAVEKAVLAACHEVYRIATTERGRAGMGTTLTLIKLVGFKAILGHVGDSRLYLYRRGVVEQVSQDHSMVAEFVRMGMIKPEDANTNPYRHVLTHAIGTQASVPVDTLAIDVFAGDRFLICSDGLGDYIESAHSLATFLEEELTVAAQELVKFANERGGEDNITVVVVDILGEPTADLPAVSAADLMRRFEAMRDVDLFRDLPLSQLQSIINAATVSTFHDGDIVLEQGGMGEAMYVVLEGGLHVVVGTHDIGAVLPGGAIGETMLMSPRPSPATLTALGETRVLTITGAALEQVLRKRPRLGLRVLRKLGTRAVVALDRAHGELRKADVGHDETWSQPGDLF